MEARKSVSPIVYIIDESDRITGISENWLPFARDNRAGETCNPDLIITKSIWDFIDGPETTQLYEIIFNAVRTSHKAIVVPFRCDAPDKRRYLELIITPIDHGHIEFTSSTIREELRDTVEILESGRLRTDEFIKMCSMCKKVEVSENSWEETESAVVSMNLFEKIKLPRISHGLCPECFGVSMAEVEKFSP
jgi:hypothetical protein